MYRLHAFLIGVFLSTTILAAPTVHLQDHFLETTAEYDSVPSVTQAPQLQPRAHVVEPTWITVTMPPVSYNPSGTDPKPHVMPPYISYVPIAPHQQPMVGPWPQYYPNLPVLPYPYPSNHLCNQPMGSYRV
uniref:VM domain-containing protein n=1 Tax=Anopheles christyi TaxID=43041 RepID=A0A182K473_9DIPT